MAATKPGAACRACGAHLEPHCPSTTCPWQRCKRTACAAYGYHNRSGWLVEPNRKATA